MSPGSRRLMLAFAAGFLLATVLFAFRCSAPVSPVSGKRLALTNSVPPFYIDPSRGEYQMEFYNTMLMLRILGGQCMPYGFTSPAVFVDIGAFFGWYTFWAAKLGCEVVTFEPNAKRVFDRYLLLANNIADRVTVLSNPVSDTTQLVEVHGGDEQAFYSPASGTVQPGRGDASGRFMRTVRLVDALPIDSQFGLIKIDTEGAEILVLRSVMQLIEAGAVVNDIIFECTPKWWQDFGVDNSTGLALIEAFVDKGYALHSILWSARGIRDSGSPHRVGHGVDWHTDPMHHVQRVPLHRIRAYVSSVHRQRDFWLHRVAAPLADPALRALPEVLCADADQFATPDQPTCREYS